MPKSVTALLTAAAQRAPDGLAVTEAEGRAVTWQELEDEASRVAAGLGGLGLVAVPVNPRSTAAELERMVADSGARVAVVDAASCDAVREVAERLGETAPVVVVVGAPPAPGERSYEQLSAATARSLPGLLDEEALAVLLYTSGTSGLPRAAMLTHRALKANVAQVAAVEPPMITAEDVVLGILPLFHVYGLNGVLGSVLHSRAKLVLADGFDPVGTLDLIEDEAVSVVPVAPPVFGHWLPVEDLEERLGPVRLLLSGSAPLSAEVVERFVALTGKPVHQGYGLTEAAPVVCSTLASGVDVPGSVGVPLPGIEVRVVGDDGTVLDGEPGEIEVRGDNLFSGYWPDGSGGPGPEGWWATGDVGYLDADDNLHLVDRLKEIVIVSGFNVYPAEVENVIETVPGVRQAAVVGVADDETGEAVVAYVVPAGSPEGLADQVEAACGERLAGFKRPSVVHLVEELPRTVTGKVQKGRLRTVARRQRQGLLE